jgi:hypothetical protein
MITTFIALSLLVAPEQRTEQPFASQLFVYEPGINLPLRATIGLGRGLAGGEKIRWFERAEEHAAGDFMLAYDVLGETLAAEVGWNHVGASYKGWGMPTDRLRLGLAGRYRLVDRVTLLAAGAMLGTWMRPHDQRNSSGDAYTYGGLVEAGAEVKVFQSKRVGVFAFTRLGYLWQAATQIRVRAERPGDVDQGDWIPPTPVSLGRLTLRGVGWNVGLGFAF